MRQNEVFKYYRKDVENLTLRYEYIKSLIEPSTVDELCAKRGYVDKNQTSLMHELKIGRCCINDIEELGDVKISKNLGMITDKDRFLLDNRYIIPVEDIAGNLVSLIGYYPDIRKYITLPTQFFSKEVMFFNFHQAYELSWSKFHGLVIVVEGIFDCLSLRSIGLPAMATMGADVSKTKGELLKLFSKVLGIPDDDKVGRKSLNRHTKTGWQVPDNTTMIKLIGGEFVVNPDDDEDLHIIEHIKDMDNVVSWFEADDIIDMMLELAKSQEEVEVLDLRG